MDCLPSTRILNVELRTGKFDFLNLSNDVEVVKLLFPLGEEIVEFSDVTSLSTGSDSEEKALSMAMTPHAIYFVTDESPLKVEHKLQIKEIERITWDPDGRTVVVSPTNAKYEAPILFRFAETGGRRYHFHSRLRKLYEVEAYSSLPSIVATCNLAEAECRRIVILRIKQSSQALNSSQLLQLDECVASLSKQYQQDTDSKKELRELNVIAEKVELGHFMAEKKAAWDDISDLEKRLSEECRQELEFEQEIELLTTQLVESEQQLSIERRRRDECRQILQRKDAVSSRQEIILIIEAESWARTVLAFEWESLLATVDLLRTRSLSQLLLKEKDAEVRTVAAELRDREYVEGFPSDSELKFEDLETSPETNKIVINKPIVVQKVINIADLIEPPSRRPDQRRLRQNIQKPTSKASEAEIR